MFRTYLCGAFVVLALAAGAASAGEAFRGWVELDGTGAKLHAGDAGAAAKALAAGGPGALDSGDLEGMTVQYVRDGGRGPTIVSMRRELGGVPVHGERALLIADPGGVPRSFHATLKLRAGDLAAERKRTGRFAWPETKAGAREDRWWVVADGRLVPAYREYGAETTPEGPALFAYLRSALDGNVLKKASVTDRAAFGYRVYADPDGRPFDNPFGFTEPHPTGVPDGSAPSVAESQNLVFVESMSATSGVPWLPAGATETAGNHADVFFNSLLLPDGTYDSLFNTAPGNAWGPGFQPADGDFRAQAASGVFDYVYDHAIAPSDFFQLPSDPVPFAPDPNDPQLNAKIVQAFYMANYLHDFFYDAGFTEAAGNAQVDNFGRGGLDGDPMIINAGSITTVISTPGDGESPVMLLGRNSFSASNKDSTLDWSVFAHEWGHYLVRRLVGGGVSLLENNQGRSINEGWADLLGVFMAVREDHVTGPGTPGLTSTYAAGAYTNRDYFFPITVIAGTAPADAHFYGVRRWPYGPSNPFTFRHIEHGEPFPGPPSDFFDWKTRSIFNTEVHSAGEIWAASVWDCFRDIFAARTDRGFAANRAIMGEYIVTGMMATPPNPTFTEARDGLLAAIRAADRRDYDTCRAAFAGRGLGAGAVSPERFDSAHAGVVESFDAGPLAVTLLESHLDDSLLPMDADGVLDNTGEVGNLKVVVRNTGFETLRRVVLRVPSTGDYRIMDRAPRVIANLPPGEDAVANFPVMLRHMRDYDATPFALDFDARGGRGEHRRELITFTHRTHFDMVPWKGADNAEFPETFSDWAVVSDPPADFFSSLAADPTWERIERPDAASNHAYRAGERYVGLDLALVSPPLAIPPGPGSDLEIHFDHAFNFVDDVPPVGTVHKGAAVVEYSTDGGGSWVELASYGGESAGFPALASEQLHLGPGFGGTTVRVRFRIFSGTKFVPVEQAWFLDNIFFLGQAGEPFTRVVPEDGA